MDLQLTGWQPETWPVATDWQPVVTRFLQSESAQNLQRFIKGRLDQGAAIYPPKPFRALELTPLERVKVVVLGQDPYHGAGQAHGLAFSVGPGVRIPPSLRNIHKEISRELALANPRNIEPEPENFRTHPPGWLRAPGPASPQASGGSLEHWARQGVLLLNTCLTVEDGAPASHAKRGWEALTDNIIQTVWAAQPCAVFMLWGAHAQAKQALLDGPGKRHLVLSANHPSPLSALRPPLPFMGCGHFGLANAHLVKNGLAPVLW
jgi:uracil-DNA glycosylase